MAHAASWNTSRSASPNRSRSQSPSPRAANGSKVVKKVPWVDPNSNKHAVPNSPSEMYRRNSTSKGGLGSMSLRALFEHNENEWDLSGSKLNKARSPAVAATLKCTKNFMSPTISASSNVTAASPRRGGYCRREMMAPGRRAQVKKVNFLRRPLTSTTPYPLYACYYESCQHVETKVTACSLQDSLGGNSKTIIIANISPSN